MSRAIPESKWKWFGHAGHFICGQWCRFHLTTKVGRVLVSTVGQYVHPSDSGANEATEAEWLAKNPNGRQVGCERFYETMVFRAGKPCAAKGCACGMPKIDPSEIDFEGYQTPGEANAGHLAMCRKWARKSPPRKRRGGGK